VAAGLPVLAVVGLVALQELNSPSPERLTLEGRASLFKELLEAKGFTARLSSYPRIGYYVVDFHDPNVEREIVEKFAPYDREKVELYAWGASRGSVAFYARRTEGEFPIVTMRKPISKGSLWESLTPPAGIKITTLHLRAQDRLPSVHVHFEGVTETAHEIRELSEFVAKARDITKKFLQ